jgi:cytochrome b subunit of formate dehydrogenase
MLLTACSRRPERPRHFGNGSSREQPASREVDVSLEALADSVHADVDCAKCHVQSPGTPPTQSTYAGDTKCVPCHQEAADAYEKSVHAEALSEGNEGAARCLHCHGAHDTHKVDDPRSRVSHRQLPFTCAQCHLNPDVATKLGIQNKFAAERYFESIHGQALIERGFLAAPSCVDCHGTSHGILKASDPKSTVHRDQIPKTCGKCHEGVSEAYATSIHAKGVREGVENAPVCVDCHTAHQVVEPDGAFVLASDHICGECHADMLRRYQLTYHGRAHSLGDEQVAACFDCHGAHAILPSSDPNSALSEERRQATCQRCHANASKNFAKFLPHGDHHDRERYPRLFYAFAGMTSLLVGTFAFFWLHTVLWFIRGLRDYFRNPQAFREAKEKARVESARKVYVRFEPVDRLCHFLLVLSFLLLVVTGMPIKFHNTEWARVVFAVLGGPGAAAALHRVGAFLTATYMLIHVTRMVRLLWQTRERWRDEEGRFRVASFLGVVFGPDSPLPNLQDARDAYAHLRYFLGLGPRPAFDRFTYWEKFDYMAVFWGVTIIGVSGLIMWFPVVVTYVLPGWVINIAHIIHSDEALLAAGFIFTVHFFNSHLRPDKFPMDTVIFSGALTEHELKHERPRLYARLEGSGQLEDLAIKTDWKGWKPIMTTLGTIFVVLGSVLAVAIFWALFGSLAGH